ncbi:inorganic phosphate transporter [Aromatoleum sp.]|uniref:inorganic phosphate transporter n=1 Tax=Aromatoleum sp. TaxID=2307007 RepID=UPI002FC9D170
MEFEHISQIEQASRKGSGEILRLGLALIYIIGAMLFAARVADGENAVILAIAAVLGGYMAINIGANDVGNNVGPAVGARAMSLGVALAIAAMFEAAGALIAGGEVVGTMRSGIFDPARIVDREALIWSMLAALMGAGLFLNVATAFGAPVSTTHAIVGALLGAGVAAHGADVVNWQVIMAVVVSWIVSPLLGGAVAAGFLYLIKRRILFQADMVGAAICTVPYLLAAMAFAFSSYLLMQGRTRLLEIDLVDALLVGVAAGVVVFFVARPLVARRARSIANTRKSVNRLFTLPLIVAAALLSFAHGSNDVANAVGPLSAIVVELGHGGVMRAPQLPVPLWTMLIGALGICVGLALFGPRIVRTIGSEITELDQMRAFCVAMSAAVTVLIASAFGLPVSSTHIAVGAVFGVGFLREYLLGREARMIADIKAHHPDADQDAIEAFIARFTRAGVAAKGEMLSELKERSKRQLDPANFSKSERRQLRQVYKDELVKRSQIRRIVSAWLVTVPAAAVLGSVMFFAIRGMMLDLPSP